MLTTDERLAAGFFLGTEVENTPRKGDKVLFVVGIKPVAEIARLVEAHDVNHVYLGTSQSFKPSCNEAWEQWSNLVRELLDANFWVTLDFDVEYADGVLEEGWPENRKFIPMISVKLPYINQFGYNAVLKLDDTTWGVTNPGVWTHQLHALMTREAFTGWDEYVGDANVTNTRDRDLDDEGPAA